MTSDNDYVKVDWVSCGRYMFVSLRSMALRIGETRHPSGTWSSTESKEVGWAVISNASVGTASMSN